MIASYALHPLKNERNNTKETEKGMWCLDGLVMKVFCVHYALNGKCLFTALLVPLVQIQCQITIRKLNFLI